MDVGFSDGGKSKSLVVMEEAGTSIVGGVW